MKIMVRTIITLCLLSGSAAMADVYKCTDNTGEVVFQGEPCREGSQVKVDIRFGEQQTDTVPGLITGSWCEVGTSTQLSGTVFRDNALRKTWIFSERQMVQHISQNQRADTFKYPIRQMPGAFVIDHPAFGNGDVNWQVKRLTDEQLIIAAYGGYTHLTAGECEITMASSN